MFGVLVIKSSIIVVFFSLSSPSISLQIRFGSNWSGFSGSQSDNPVEMELFEGESIVQVSGKVGRYVQWLVFTTNTGRSLYAGQPDANSFNMYAGHKEAELRSISGQFEGGITSIKTHWDEFNASSRLGGGGRGG